MALEAMNEIKKVETKAEELIQDARKTAKDEVASAEREAKTQYDNIVAEAKNQAQKIINLGVEEGNSESRPIIDIGKKEIDDIKNMSQEVKERAINIVVERIVKIDGNS